METASITPSLDGRVWLKSVRYPMLNRPIDVLNWDEVTLPGRSTVREITGRSVPVATHEQRSSRRFNLHIVTDDLRENPTADPQHERSALELRLAVGDTFLVHVPAGQPVPGGYVTIGDLSYDRTVPHGTDNPYRFTLPCTVVAPPAPDVVGTTLTWGTVMRLFGSWEALVAAHPDWASLLAVVGSPDDLVVV